MAEVAWAATAGAVIRAFGASGAVADQERRVDVSDAAKSLMRQLAPWDDEEVAKDETFETSDIGD